MNTTVDLDSSNEGENLNPNIEILKPKIEKGTGEKLGDTIELSSDGEESDISITEEKKPILKRSTAAFNSTKNENMSINGANEDVNLSAQTPFLTPQSSTPATAYKSLVTSTPAETPRFKLADHVVETTPPTIGLHSESFEEDAEDDNDISEQESSSTTESADSTQNLSDAGDNSINSEKGNLTYQSSETIRVGEETSINIKDGIEDDIEGVEGSSSEHDEKPSIEVDSESSVNNKNHIDGGGDNAMVISDSKLGEDQLKASNTIENIDSIHVATELNGSEEIHNEVSEGEDPTVSHETSPEDNEPTRDVAVVDSSSGEESDVEDEETTKEDLQSSSNLTLPSKKRRLEDVQNLPETCTLLRTKNGGRVYVVGTAHFSHESQVDVATVIQTVQPDIVVLELCKERTNILHLDEETVLEEAKNLTMDKMILAIKQNGTVQGVMYLLLLSMSAHLTKELGMAPGGEFRRAFREAHSVPGCLVHLGDRPINITLKRALGSLSLWQKLKLGFNILTSKDTITKEDVEKCKQKDLLESMLEEMAGEFPALSRVFVQERDLYLAHSLKLAANRPFGGHSPTAAKASKQPTEEFSHEPVVVGVVGIGHVPGIVENWETVTPEDVAQVVFIPPMSTTEKMTRLTIRVAFGSLALYAGYRMFRSPVSKAIAVIQRTIIHR